MAREELDWWAGGWGRELGNGIFGENLTITELDVDGAVVGERWVIGDVDGAVVLEVTGPRIRCRTFAGHMGERGWVRRFTERGPHSHSPRHRATAPPRALIPTQSVCLSAPQHGQTHTERAGPGAGRDEAPVRDRGLGCSGRCRVLSRRGGRGRCDA